MRKLVVLLGAAGAVALVLWLLFASDPPATDFVPQTDEPPRLAAEVDRPEIDDRTVAADRERVAAEAEAAPAAGPPPAYLEALGGITGRIVETEGTPIPGLRVEALAATLPDLLPELGSVFGDQPPAIEVSKGLTRTGDDGRFLFEGLEIRGVYLLGIDLGGARAALRFVDQAPNPGQLVDLGDIVLEPYAIFTGRIVDARKSPVPGARVRATNLPSLIFSFGVQDLRPGFAVAFQENLESKWRVAPIPAWVTRLVDRLPIPQTLTAEDGTFRLEGVQLGMVTVLVDKADLVSLVHGPVPSGAGGEKHLGDLALPDGETLTGVVVDGGDSPVAGAEIMVGPQLEMVPAGVLWPAAVTDAEGRFTVKGLKDQEHIVAARRQGRVEWALVHDVAPGFDEPVIRLGDTYRLTIVARNLAGEILPRPQVAVQPQGDLPVHPLLVPPIALAGRIDYREDGAVHVSELDPGRYAVLAKAAGYAVQMGSADLRDGPDEIELLLEDELFGEAIVLDATTREPLEWTLVGIFDPDAAEDALKRVPLKNARAGADGIARLTGLKPGKYQAAALHPAYATTAVEVMIPGPRVEILLRPGGTLAGRVRAGNEPPEKPRFIAIGARREERFPRFTVTDENGEFEVTHLEPGDYNVTIMRRFADQSLTGQIGGGFEQYMPERFEEAKIEEGAVTWLDVDILGVQGGGPTAKLKGRIQLDNGPGAQLTVTARPEGDWRNQKHARTDAAGGFDFGDVPAGGVTVTVAQPGQSGRFMFGQMAEQKVTLAADEVREILFDIRTGRVRGQVVLERDNSPVIGAEVSLRPMESSGDGPFSGIRMNTASDRDGSFLFTAVPAGRYQLRVRRDDFADAVARDVDVPFGGEPPPLRVRLAAGILVKGVVELPRGTEPPRFVWVEFQSQDEPGRRAGGRADRKTLGFQVKGLEPGRYQVRVHSEQPFEPIDVMVPSGGMEDLVLRPVAAPPPEPQTVEVKPGGF